MLMNVPTEVITVIPMPHVQIQKEVLHVLAILASVATELIAKVHQMSSVYH